MNIKQYYEALKAESEAIFQLSVQDQERLGKLRQVVTAIQEFAPYVHDPEEREVILIVANQIDSAIFSVLLGLYRQANSSLRLCLELGFGCINFSVNRLDFKDWLSGKADIRWSDILDEQTGVLSDRFINAFFPEVLTELERIRNQARKIYRELSEHVHGNYKTWKPDQLNLQHDSDKVDFFAKNATRAAEVFLFLLCVRYLKAVPTTDLDSLASIREALEHIDAIREFLGGPRRVR